MVFPAHDYKGDTVSTIGEERRYNPRLQVRSIDEYIELMNNLKLPNPKLMDVVIPAKMHVGLRQDDLAKQGLALTFGHGRCRGEGRRPDQRGAYRGRDRCLEESRRTGGRGLTGHGGRAHREP
jgi:hypothetical protein